MRYTKCIVIENDDFKLLFRFDVESALLGWIKKDKGGYVIHPKPPNGYRIRVDPQNTGTNTQKHWHIEGKGNEDFAINEDGTFRHKPAVPYRIPKSIKEWIKKNLPTIPLPVDGMIQLI